MRLIKLTSLQDKQPIYINVDTIGHFYEVKEEIKYGRVEKAKHTRVGVLTHNNGGFSVIEDVNKILKLIEESRGI
jgi:hypothetical protein